MNYKLYTEDKIDLLQLAFVNLQDYSDKSYGLLEKTKRVLHLMVTREDQCKNMDFCIERLRCLIIGMERKIKMKENFEAVIKQVDFSN
ncbi:MAG: hypothetical protein JWQ25_2275 [Daejeonella sp.]|nr:hypothetical protein [Daejeonella sp.]